MRRKVGSRSRNWTMSIALSVEQLEDRLVPAITYHGGPVLSHVELEAVYYGSYWGNGVGAQQGSDLNTYLQFITNSSYMDMLAEYGVGRGTVVDSGIADPGIAGAQTIDDSQLRSAISTDISRGFLQAPDPNRLYMVFTAPNVTVTDGNENSLNNFYGYHDSFIDPSLRVIRYAVIAHPVGNGDAPGLNDFQTLTWVVSHELAESATNPDNGGWYDTRTNDEIADLCNSVDDAGILNGHVVSGVWSVQQNSCVIPADAQPFSSVMGAVPSFQLRQEVATDFVTSDEYLSRIIVTDYQQLLGRTPAPAEVAGWVAATRLGMTDEQVLAGFTASAEYYQRAGGTDRAWIDALYRDLLGRTPAMAEENAWLQLIASGMDRHSVAYGFAHSSEHESRVVISDYQTYLGRSAAPSEVANWVLVFEQGTMTNEQITAVFAASDEFFAGQGGTVESWLTGLYLHVLGRPADKDGFAAWDAFVHNAIG
jgi:hypothetical protein